MFKFLIGAIIFKIGSSYTIDQLTQGCAPPVGSIKQNRFSKLSTNCDESNFHELGTVCQVSCQDGSKPLNLKNVEITEIECSRVGANSAFSWKPKGRPQMDVMGGVRCEAIEEDGDKNDDNKYEIIDSDTVEDFGEMIIFDISPEDLFDPYFYSVTHSVNSAEIRCAGKSEVLLKIVPFCYTKKTKGCTWKISETKFGKFKRGYGLKSDFLKKSASAILRPNPKFADKWNC